MFALSINMKILFIFRVKVALRIFLHKGFHLGVVFATGPSLRLIAKFSAHARIPVRFRAWSRGVRQIRSVGDLAGGEGGCLWANGVPLKEEGGLLRPHARSRCYTLFSYLWSCAVEPTLDNVHATVRLRACTHPHIVEFRDSSTPVYRGCFL